MKKVILYELNEVPFRVLDDFCANHPESTFAKKLRMCSQYETFSEDTAPLSPWITWPSLHRGVTDRFHHIRAFGQDLAEVDRMHPPIWKILAENSIRTGVCGSLHSYPLPAGLDRYAFYLPDTFAKTAESFPGFLTTFQEFNLQMARNSPRNVSKAIPLGPTLRVLGNASRIGLRPRTFVALGAQLKDEVFHPWRSTRRRSFQSVLQFDVFLKLLVHTQPDFASFFSNHVASAMHRYWAAAYPEDYERNQYDSGWIARYRCEIEFAMEWADRFFTDLVSFVEAHRGYVLWVATSMGQAAWNGYPVDTQLYLKDAARFASSMGLEPGTWSTRPAMLPVVNLFVDESRQRRFEESLKQLIIDGKPFEFSTASGGFFSLHFGHVNLHRTPQMAVLRGKPVPFSQLGLECRDIEDKAASSGYHIPNGMLLVYDPGRVPLRLKEERPGISTLEIAPALLANFGVPIPSYMKKPSIIGAS